MREYTNNQYTLPYNAKIYTNNTLQYNTIHIQYKSPHTYKQTKSYETKRGLQKRKTPHTRHTRTEKGRGGEVS